MRGDLKAIHCLMMNSVQPPDVTFQLVFTPHDFKKNYFGHVANITIGKKKPSKKFSVSFFFCWHTPVQSLDPMHILTVQVWCILSVLCVHYLQWQCSHSCCTLTNSLTAAQWWLSVLHSAWLKQEGRRVYLREETLPTCGIQVSCIAMWRF